ncbi:hypothetical protein [Halioxenophilus sp. WMMB6]|uniref:hypothetical protein n=1 Tax=Halioxenophilus sp. WMMB6 TaxID=3073815 RepID=UPI00295F3E48|nr:hypothetical protein [Halioxenophilus sp. WMMB6]
MKDHPDRVASGIDALVERLRREGVEAAQTESAKIVEQAKQQAVAIVAEAKARAEQELKQAQEQIALEKRAATDALQIAYRDLILELKSHLLSRFSEDVERLVRTTVEQPDLLRQLVLATVGRIVDDANLGTESEVELALPPEVLDIDDITHDPDSASRGLLADFVFAVQGKILREGVSFKAGDESQAGITLRLKNDGIEVDVTDKAIADLLLKYLNPRFRAVLDGIIH